MAVPLASHLALLKTKDEQIHELLPVMKSQHEQIQVLPYMQGGFMLGLTYMQIQVLPTLTLTVTPKRQTLTLTRNHNSNHNQGNSGSYKCKKGRVWLRSSTEGKTRDNLLLLSEALSLMWRRVRVRVSPKP